MLKTSVISLDNKKKWNEVLRFDMMSSEEDDSEEEDVIIVRPLPWRSPSLSTISFLHWTNGPKKRKQIKLYDR